MELRDRIMTNEERHDDVKFFKTPVRNYYLILLVLLNAGILLLEAVRAYG